MKEKIACHSGIMPVSCARSAEIAAVWRASVLASHDFLAAEDVDFYGRVVMECLPDLRLFAVLDGQDAIAAFAGVSPGMLEMLFVRPEDFGNGLGSLLLRHAVRSLGARRVDVNEQNPRALAFYARRGFAVCGRDAADAWGRPYPILHMKLAPPAASDDAAMDRERARV